MDIAVFGLGYVGAVSAACLSTAGHTVVGVDSNAPKVELINAGRSPVVEPGVEEMIAAAVAGGRLRATTDVRAAIRASELAIVCVGTPSLGNGDLDLSHVRRVCEDIALVLRDKTGFTAIVIRSTVLPGTLRNLVIPTLEGASGKRAGEDFGVGFFPEFLRESTAVADFDQPPKVVIAASDGRTRAMLEALNANGDAPVTATGFEVAEMVKYADNAWHALEGRLRQRDRQHLQGARRSTATSVMDIFLPGHQAQHLAGLPAAGLRLRRLLPAQGRARAQPTRRRRLDLELPLLNAIMPSNTQHIDRALQTGARPERRNGRRSRPELQGRHRRPAREPGGRAGRTPARQGP